MSEIPQAMVEAAARALADHRFTQYAYGYGRRGCECSCGTKRDHRNPILEDEDGRFAEALDEFINGHQAEVALAAALAVCAVREQWGQPDDSDIWMTTENIRDAVPPKDITTPP